MRHGITPSSYRRTIAARSQLPRAPIIHRLWLSVCRVVAGAIATTATRFSSASAKKVALVQMKLQFGHPVAGGHNLVTIISVPSLDPVFRRQRYQNFLCFFPLSRPFETSMSEPGKATQAVTSQITPTTWRPWTVQTSLKPCGLSLWLRLLSVAASAEGTINMRRL